MAQTASAEDEYFTISWKKLLAISGGIMLIGAVVMAVGFWMGNQARLLETEGLEATALITGKNVRERRSSSSMTPTKEYSVRFQFSVENQLYRERGIVSRAFYDSVEAGDSVPVRYLAADPTINEIEPGQHQIGSLIAMGIGAALILLGIGILFLPRKVKKPS